MAPSDQRGDKGKREAQNRKGHGEECNYALSVKRKLSFDFQHLGYDMLKNKFYDRTEHCRRRQSRPHERLSAGKEIRHYSNDP